MQQRSASVLVVVTRLQGAVPGATAFPIALPAVALEAEAGGMVSLATSRVCGES